jgi:site-specific recombinase XerC
MSAKLKNLRLLRISFHTFSHWKATMEYHKTKDILHVMQLLGHRNIKNTLIYTQLVDFKDDDYVARVAHSKKEACQLIEAGFDFVCDYNGNKLFRKRK